MYGLTGTDTIGTFVTNYETVSIVGKKQNARQIIQWRLLIAFVWNSSRRLNQKSKFVPFTKYKMNVILGNPYKCLLYFNYTQLFLFATPRDPHDIECHHLWWDSTDGKAVDSELSDLGSNPAIAILECTTINRVCLIPTKQTYHQLSVYMANDYADMSSWCHAVVGLRVKS